MDNNQILTYINSQVACALIEMHGMVAENKQRESDGRSMAYTQNDFDDLSVRYKITREAVTGGFSDGWFF